MVMDATQPQQPSPQSVGREFVRQYYTLLNKAPSHLHRFYNNNSSFIHGESTLVVGQREIHNRIQQLNFNDCHAKISQVDAQATLGNGVVVQVTGELSNDGQPMRRFTQTFVLAAQSPKKYYVHNDIFRYQDHLYTDDEADGDTRSENGEEHDLQAVVSSASGNDQQSQAGAVVSGNIVDQQLASQVVSGNAVTAVPQQLQQQQQVSAPSASSGGSPPQQIFYSMPAANAGGRPVPVLPAAPQASAVPMPAQFTAAASQQVQTGQLNGIVGHDELLSAQQQPLVAQNASTLIQPSGGIVSVAAGAGTPVLQSSVGIVQASAGGIPGFQQSPLVSAAGLQQQQLSNTSAQQSLLHTQPIQPTSNATNVIDVDDNSAVNTINSNSISENTTRSNVASTTTVPKPPTPVVVDDFKTINEQQQQEKYEAAKQQQNEPKTYANLFKSTSSSPSGFVNAALQQQQQLQQQQTLNNVYHSTSSIAATSYTTSTSSVSISYTNTNARVDNNLNANNGSLPQRNNSIRNNKDYEQRRPSNAQFGDNHQLFLGNIPHHASEEDLRNLFSRFGNVLDLRILSKPSNKLPPGVRNPLNYGFITYDDPEAVHKCLANCPLYYPENSPDAQKLNVEEKKARPRNDLPPRQPINNNNNNNMNNNINRGIGGGGGGNGSQTRSVSNSNNVMRNNGTNGGISRAGGSGGGGPRLGGNGGFQRNDRNGGSSNGPLRSSGNNNSNPQSGNTYGRR